MPTSLCVALVAFIASSLTAHAQTTPPAGQAKFPPDKFVNLQVMPPDTRPDVLIQAMKNFTRALGVRCQFCHLGKEGQPLNEFDFVSDQNPKKNSARNMMRMAAEINARLTKDMPDAATKGFQVTCYTCHRGAEHPLHSPEAAPKPPGH
jgi:photosynthetic reaction center cytochrome c subunit